MGNFYTIRPWKVVGTLNLDSSYVTFKCFPFLSIARSCASRHNGLSVVLVVLLEFIAGYC